MVDIDLSETPLEGKPFTPLILDRTEDDWVNCQVDTGKFKGRGGPSNLREIMRIFCEWAEIKSRE
jgi:hypothetical protein